MKKPLLSEMTLREKIGQMLAPMQWDVYEKDENNYDFSKSDWNRVRKTIEKEQFGTIRGEQIGVYFADPDNDEKVRKIENMEEGLNAWFEYLVEPKPYREFLTKQAKLGKIPPLVGDEAHGLRMPQWHRSAPPSPPHQWQLRLLWRTAA